MPSKHPSDYTQEEVNIFLNSIGLGHKIDSFKENGVDGPMIVTLTKEDLTNDLEMSNLQARKFQMSLDFAKELVEGGGGGSTSGTDHKEIINSLKEQIKSLEDENEFLKSDVKYLNGVIEDMQQHHASAPELIPEPILEPMSEPMPEPMPPPPATAPHYQPTATAVTTERSTHSTQSRSHSPKPRSNSSTPTRGMCDSTFVAKFSDREQAPYRDLPHPQIYYLFTFQVNQLSQVLQVELS